MSSEILPATCEECNDDDVQVKIEDWFASEGERMAESDGRNNRKLYKGICLSKNCSRLDPKFNHCTQKVEVAIEEEDGLKRAIIYKIRTRTGPGLTISEAKSLTKL